MLKPHFVRNHNRLVRHLIAVEPDYEMAMARAVGGKYAEEGARQRRVLESYGLHDSHYLIDVGAGSGRLATALKDLQNLRYLGTDVVPELLEFARKKCGRADWTFKQINRIEIPEEDGVADFVVFFSVFTHLKEEESFRYLQEAKRVLKTNGTIVLSYLDPEIEIHTQVLGNWWKQRLFRMAGKTPLNKLLSKTVLDKWSKALNLTAEYLDAHIGQSVCVYRLSR
jgi:ubiquinone/menaquinone biosynthesis C-methylase UbiE